MDSDKVLQHASRYMLGLNLSDTRQFSTYRAIADAIAMFHTGFVKIIETYHTQGEFIVTSYWDSGSFECRCVLDATEERTGYTLLAFICPPKGKRGDSTMAAEHGRFYPTIHKACAFALIAAASRAELPRSATSNLD